MVFCPVSLCLFVEIAWDIMNRLEPYAMPIKQKRFTEVQEHRQHTFNLHFPLLHHSKDIALCWQIMAVMECLNMACFPLYPSLKIDRPIEALIQYTHTYPYCGFFQSHPISLLSMHKSKMDKNILLKRSLHPVQILETHNR